MVYDPLSVSLTLNYVHVLISVIFQFSSGLRSTELIVRFRTTLLITIRVTGKRHEMAAL